MVSLPGSHSAWWYGRAIRLYFIFSMVISATWIFKILYIDPAPVGFSFSSENGARQMTPPKSAADVGADANHHRSVVVDESNVQLANPSIEYVNAFTDHIYCLNAFNKLGRKGRMTELFKFLHLDVEMVTSKRINHFDAWRDMINRGYQRALIVEDDIDFELDAVPVIRQALETLNTTSTSWDILYVGHCSVDEGQGKAKGGNARLHRSTRPFCTSGYILSYSGVRKLFSYFAKQQSSAISLDISMVALIKRGLLRSYSIHPPAVFQRRDLYPSDDGMKLKVANMLKNSAWDMATSFVPVLANWTDPLDREYLNPAYRHLPSWMEDVKAASF
ncbi:hypothetical protein GGI12_003075 [Dipsacomyces acuminosporus]|nr:hypothetical protein GGI12_003075 [Dipsacomyces acuminosporus]